jgi:hypothetical protein
LRGRAAFAAWAREGGPWPYLSAGPHWRHFAPKSVSETDACTQIRLRDPLSNYLFEFTLAAIRSLLPQAVNSFALAQLRIKIEIELKKHQLASVRTPCIYSFYFILPFIRLQDAPPFPNRNPSQTTRKLGTQFHRYRRCATLK